MDQLSLKNHSHITLLSACRITTCIYFNITHIFPIKSVSLYALTQASLMATSATYQPHLKPILNEELTPQRYRFKLCKFMQEQPLQHFIFCVLHSSSSSQTAETKEHEESSALQLHSLQLDSSKLFITPFSTLRNTDFKYRQKMHFIARTEFLSVFKWRCCLSIL